MELVRLVRFVALYRALKFEDKIQIIAIYRALVIPMVIEYRWAGLKLGAEYLVHPNVKTRSSENRKAIDRLLIIPMHLDLAIAPSVGQRCETSSTQFAALNLPKISMRGLSEEDDVGSSRLCKLLAIVHPKNIR